MSQEPNFSEEEIKNFLNRFRDENGNISDPELFYESEEFGKEATKMYFELKEKGVVDAITAAIAPEQLNHPEDRPIFDTPNFYALPDPILDNTDIYDFEGDGLRRGSRVLDSNWQPMFMDLDEFDEFAEEKEDAAVPKLKDIGRNFNPMDVDALPMPEDMDQKEITGPLHNLPIPFTQLHTLQRYPLLHLRRVKQTGKGKIKSFYSLTVVGNGDGLVGIGEGKSEEAEQAGEYAFAQAIRNMDYVDRFEDRTLWTDMECKFGATRLVMRPRPVGFGLMCSPGIHQVLKAAGIKDASVKIWGSRNKVNTVKIALKMLHNSSQPLGFGNGIGGKGRRLEKGVGMKSKFVMERERGRRIETFRTR